MFSAAPIVQKYQEESNKVYYNEEWDCLVSPMNTVYTRLGSNTISSSYLQTFSNALLDKLPVYLKIDRDINTNAAFIELKIHENMLLGDTKKLTLNDKNMNLSNKKLDNDYIIYKITNYEDGGRIYFNEIKKMSFLSYTRRRGHANYYLAFDLIFKFSTTKNDVGINDDIFKTPISTSVIKSASFVIVNKSMNLHISKLPSLSKIHKLETKVNFYEPKIGIPWNKVATSTTKLLSNEPDENFDFENIENNKPALISELEFGNETFPVRNFTIDSHYNKISKTEYSYDYLISDNFQYNLLKKQFEKKANGNNPGFYIPLNFSGNIFGKLIANENNFPNFKELDFKIPVFKPFFNKKDGIIKLNVNNVNISEEEMFKSHEIWKEIEKTNPLV
ncbi:hypothetical protein DA803_01435 [[Mycoplasma] phocae]|uniref:Uncharacterized protein n=1 Tax=[Mycoplasma] phocae TaxID=142651 RepID=A0A2Z5IQA9_9BACT|nr:hypothetical protein [[Mycoplasma] phocae]AXE60747.1 hypothetical protein DA803_01435 [[Mycoplasma] phocae]